jgi:hypothetical protein
VKQYYNEAMSKVAKNLQFGGMAVVIIMALLLLSFIFGWIDKETLQDTFVKAVAVVLVLVFASIALSSIAGGDK